VNTIGTLGILEAAAAKCLISLPDALERLRATSMFISDELLAQSLQRDSKRRGV
jgi:predicted nucleic acid-binding protein